MACALGTLPRFALWNRPDPQSQSPLEKGDRLFDQADYETALVAYQTQAKETDRDDDRQEAIVRSGLCLTKLGRDAEADETLATVFREQGELWPALAGCQLWASLLKQDRRTDADGVFTTLSSQFRFDRLAPLVPRESRSIILDAYFNDQRDFLTRTLKHDPQQITKLEQAGGSMKNRLPG
jgi:hypothetical protein